MPGVPPPPDVGPQAQGVGQAAGNQPPSQGTGPSPFSQAQNPIVPGSLTGLSPPLNSSIFGPNFIVGPTGIPVNTTTALYLAGTLFPRDGISRPPGSGFDPTDIRFPPLSSLNPGNIAFPLLPDFPLPTLDQIIGAGGVQNR